MLIVLTGTNVFTYQTTLNQIFHLFFILFNQTYLIFTLYVNHSTFSNHLHELFSQSFDNPNSETHKHEDTATSSRKSTPKLEFQFSDKRNEKQKSQWKREKAKSQLHTAVSQLRKKTDRKGKTSKGMCEAEEEIQNPQLEMRWFSEFIPKTHRTPHLSI